MLALLFTLFLAAGVQAPEADLFERGVEAYRRADWAAAERYWSSALEEDLGAEDRARVLYNLGNAAWRGGEALRAVGYYSASLRSDPRRADTWKNLETARVSAGLEPAVRGDLRSTVRRLFFSLRPDEKRVLVLVALVLALPVLVLEALRGGRLLFGLALLSFAGLALASVPWCLGLRRGPQDPWLIVRGPVVALRSEPRDELAPSGEVSAGEEVERIDALQGWVRVRTRDGSRGWVPDDAVFPLEP